eukprot:TRINITY_DN8963_c0_g3_i1.p1 TRINITY_DN8963_c0_g3~~TRINITY_DN8963_c0_g3_i1.p1  ORF type:complete len:258 (+),score=66.10 TRINITY_DN8963_c0_g3_i1:434-1207(+)
MAQFNIAQYLSLSLAMLRALSAVRSSLLPTARRFLCHSFSDKRRASISKLNTMCPLGTAIVAPRALSRVVSLADRQRLFDTLQEEINDEKTSGVAAELPTSFADFSVMHNPGSPVVTFESEADGDKVRVRVNINECPMEEINDGEEEEAASPQANFSVDVTNPSGLVMTAECTIAHGELVINRLGYKSAAMAAEDVHEKVYMNEAAFLDDTLYDNMVAFLEEKGVTPEFCDFVEGTIADKEYMEYLKWLNQGQEFLK